MLNNQILEAADVHNVGADTPSFFSNVKSYVTGAVVSGAHSFYNTGVDVVNAFGGNAERADTLDTLQRMDSSLGEYYQYNQDAVDLGGMIAGSIIPGIGVTKLVNQGSRALAAAKAGKWGLNIGEASGLAPTLSEAFYKKAAVQLAEGTVTSRLNQTTIAGLIAGMGEQTLMVAGTEAMIAATMEANPIIEKMTWKDHAVNTAVGAAFFAPIFAGVGLASGLGVAKKAATAADLEAAPFRSLPYTPKELTDDLALTILYDAKKSFPALPEEGTVSAARLRQLDRIATETKNTIDTEILKRWQGLTGGDMELTKAMMQMADETPLDKIPGSLAFIKEIKRAGVELNIDSAISKQLDKVVKQQKLTTLYRTSDGSFYASEEAAMAAGLDDAVTKIRAQEYLGLNIKEVGAALKKGEVLDGTIDPISKQVSLITDISGKTKEAIFQAVGESERGFSKKYLMLQGAKKGTIVDEAPAVMKFGDHLAAGETVSLVKGIGAPVVKYGNKTAAQIPVGAPIDILGDDLVRVQSRYAYAALSEKLTPGTIIHETDIPFLEKAFKEGLSDFKIKLQDGKIITAPTGDSLLSLIEQQKGAVASAFKRTSSELAERINTPIDYLEGVSTASTREAQIIGEFNTSPSYAQIGIDTSKVKLVGNKLDAEVVIQQQLKAMSAEANNVFAAALGKDAAAFPAPELIDVSGITRYSRGQGFASFGQGEYFTVESAAELIGRLTANQKLAAREAVDTALHPTALKLVNNRDAAIEVEMLFKHGRSTSEAYVLQPGNRAVLKSKLAYDEAVKTNPNLKYTPENPNIPSEIQFRNQEAYDFLVEHSRLNRERRGVHKNIKAAHGTAINVPVEGEVYAPPVDFRKSPYYALVRDKVTGEMSAITAGTSDELRDAAAKVPKEFQVLYKEDTSAWHKAVGDYEWSKTISDNAVDTELRRRGILTQFFPKTDPQKIVEETLNWHKYQAEMQVRELVRLRYREQIETMKAMGTQYSAVQQSVAAKSAKFMPETIENPYEDVIKTMLDVSKASDYRAWMNPQNTIDAYVSAAFGKYEKMKASSGISEADLEAINKSLSESGYRGPLYGVAEVLSANSSTPHGVISSFVSKANSIATTFMLRLDAVQAMNNAIGTNILLSSEMQYLMKKISQRPEAAAKLDELMRVAVPGSEVTMSAPAKMIARQYSKFFADVTSDTQPIINQYTKLGWLPDHARQLRESFDSLAIRELETHESVGRLTGVWEAIKGQGKNAIIKGEVYTGNKHSEMMGRFVAAGVAQDITDIAVAAGVMSKSEQLIAINSFINKVHGATLASQRPILFQGAVGQAISLFQSYQFNLMQQLFKYIGDGNKKAAATLLGMQTATYGVQGFPAFNALNNHIIGNAAGNPEHRDIFTETYNIAGKQAGDWLLYGAAANILGVNIYSRGDLNPRQATIVPLNPMDIPFVSMSAKFVGNMYNQLNSLAQGAPAGTVFLQGLEHAGINRPLAGLASLVQGYSTTGSGSLLAKTRPNDIAAGNDWNVVATLGRMAGAKPLDESILLDANYRYTAYHASELDRMKSLGTAVKAKMLSGQEISEEEMIGFMSKYQSIGGKQENFNKQMMKWYKDSTVSTVNQTAEKLNTGAGRYLQRVMAGSTGMPDFIDRGE